MKLFDVCTKREYVDKNGEKKTKWLNLGIQKETDDGKKFMELNMFPNTPFYIFPQKPKEETPTDAGWKD